MAVKRKSRGSRKPRRSSRSSKRVMARFHPQAWIRDDAVEVDPEGPITWDVTEEIRAMPRAKALALRDSSDETDKLRDSRKAPKWIKNWGGPFYVSVEDSIRRFYLDSQTRRS